MVEKILDAAPRPEEIAVRRKEDTVNIGVQIDREEIMGTCLASQGREAQGRRNLWHGNKDWYQE